MFNSPVKVWFCLLAVYLPVVPAPRILGAAYSCIAYASSRPHILAAPFLAAFAQARKGLEGVSEIDW
jgi:hypothetical protein